LVWTCSGVSYRAGKIPSLYFLLERLENSYHYKSLPCGFKRARKHLTTGLDFIRTFAQPGRPIDKPPLSEIKSRAPSLCFKQNAVKLNSPKIEI
jgi:hypothetical protein